MQKLKTLLAPLLILTLMITSPGTAEAKSIPATKVDLLTEEHFPGWILDYARDLQQASAQRRRQQRRQATICPVDDEHSFIDSWHFRRSGGRHHKGTDIMAAMGSDAVAIQTGTIDRMGYDRLGGNYIILISHDDNRYYYAHLQNIAEGLAEGSEVIAGDLVGYVGDTGNARGAPPHIHFEYRPDMGDRVNPYPMLAEICEGAE